MNLYKSETLKNSDAVICFEVLNIETKYKLTLAKSIHMYRIYVLCDLKTTCSENL